MGTTQTNVKDEAAEVVRLPLYLLPEEITVTDEYDVRMGEKDPAQEQKEIETLAANIERDGQLQDIGVLEFPVEGGVEYRLIRGGRRRMAIALLNAALPAGAVPRKCRCTVETGLTTSEVRRKAIAENIQRKNFTAVDLAKLIAHEKGAQGWNSKDWTARAAEFFGMSRAQITTHYKILGMPEDIVKQGQQKGLSAGAMIDLASQIKPDARAEVLAKAAEKAKDEAAAKQANAPAQAQTDAGAPGTPGSTPAQTTPAQAQPSEDSGKVLRRHITEAAREIPGAVAVAKPLTRAEIVDFFSGLDGPAYGYANSPIRQFSKYFCEVFALGKGTEATLERKFDACVLEPTTKKPFSGEGSQSDEDNPAVKGKKGKDALSAADKKKMEALKKTQKEAEALEKKLAKLRAKLNPQAADAAGDPGAAGDPNAANEAQPTTQPEPEAVAS